MLVGSPVRFTVHSLEGLLDLHPSGMFAHAASQKGIRGEKFRVFHWKTRNFSPLKSPCRAAEGSETKCKVIFSAFLWKKESIENVNNSVLDELVVTDTIPLRQDALECPKIRQLSMSDILAEAVRRVCNEESISAMFGA